MLRRVSVGESFFYGMLYSVFFIGINMLVNFLTKSEDPALNFDAAIEACICIVILTIFFGFQKSGKLSSRIIWAIAIAIVLSTFIVVAEFKFGTLYAEMAIEGEKKAWGIAGIIGEWIYNLIFAKHVETATSIYKVYQIAKEIIKIALFEVWVLVLGHVTGRLPILSEKESSLTLLRIADWFDE